MKKKKKAKGLSQASARPLRTAKKFTFPSIDLDQNKWFYIIAVLYCMIVMLWFFISPATWDEDCAVRYFNTLNAFNEPGNIVSIWNRPLWVLVFMVPVQLGKFMVPLVMSLFAVLSAYFIFQSALIKKIPYAILVVPFLLFQPFFFGVAKDAMTEPLAACIVAGGLYFLLKKRYLVFALLGSFLPLARTELVIFTAIWGLILLLEKQWKYIPLLGFGLVLWSVLGWMFRGDAMYVLNETIFKEAHENRYGNLEWWTYLRRYFYVLGPVVFYFFVLGFIRHWKKFDFFIYGQFIIGITLYTLFTTTINLGNSAGFLRNLVPLSPLAAIIALYGFNFWIKGLAKSNKTTLIVSTVLLAVVALFFRNELWKHHKVLDTTHLTILPIMSILVMLTFLLFVLVKRKNALNLAKVGFFTVLVFGSSFTLLEEHPYKNMNTQRDAVMITSTIMESIDLDDRSIASNHGFLYWVLGENKFSHKHAALTKEEVDQMLPGGIVVWDNHFGNRLGSDIPLSYLESDRNNYTELFRVMDDRAGFNMVVFEKLAQGQDGWATRNRYLKENYNIPEIHLSNATDYIKANDPAQALKVIETVVNIGERLTTSHAYFMKGQIMLKYKNWVEAERALDLAIGKREKFDMASVYKAHVKIYTGKPKQAINILDDVLEGNPNLGMAHYYKALALDGLGRKQDACMSIKMAKQLKYAVSQDMVNKLCLVK